MKRQSRKQKGFTLIELVLYLALASILLLTVVTFLGVLLQSRVKNQTIAEVEQQGAQIMQLVTQTIRNAEGVNSPGQGASATSTSLNVVSAANDPTVFDLSGGVLRITEATSTPVSLNSSRVSVSGLTFENFSRSNTPGTLRIQFTMTYVNPGGINEYDYSRTFRASATLR